MRIYYQSPGCRQGTILAPVTAWRRLPGSGGTWPLYILVCLAAPWLPRTTNHEPTNGRANDTCARPSGRDGAGTARRITAITAVTADHRDGGHGCHCGHGRSRPVTDSRWSRPVTAVTTGLFRTFRTRGHGPGVTNQARTARFRVRTTPSGHDLSTAITAVVTAAAAPPGY